MKLRLVVAATAIWASLGASAMAADMAVKAPVYVEPASLSWTGGYVGAFVGYHWGDITQSGCVGICPGAGDNMNVWFGGLQFGYDWQMPNNWVIGIAARIPVLAENQSINLPGATFEVEPRFQAMLAGRLGYAMNNFLPYVAAGVALSKNKISGPFGSDSATHTGFGAGFGLEYRLARNWSVDFRYMYAKFAKETYNLGGGPEQFGDRSSNVMFGVNYRL